MKHPRPLTAAGLAAAALLMTACGGGDGTAGGAGDHGGRSGGGATASGSPSPSVSARPVLDLPSGLRIVTDWRAPAAAREAAVLGDAVNYVRAINLGVTEQDTGSEAYRFYSEPSSQARKVAEEHIRVHVDKNHSVTGTERLFRPDVGTEGGARSAVASFCVDDTLYYAKDLKSGKTLRTEPSDSDYSLFEITMVPSESEPGLWLARELDARDAGPRCR